MNVTTFQFLYCRYTFCRLIAQTRKPWNKVELQEALLKSNRDQQSLEMMVWRTEAKTAGCFKKGSGSGGILKQTKTQEDVA